VKAECKYGKPARFDDLLTLRTTLANISMAKIEHDYEVLRDGERLASARVTLALVDRSGAVQPVPQWFREIY
jgi:acyl-CoA thioester hydrolase